MKSLIKVTFSLAFTLLFLLLVEGIGWWNMRGELYQGDVGYFWKMKPSLSQEISEPQPFLLKTNSEGFRDDERPSNLNTILLLGCSTTLGWGVNREETFEYLLDSAHPDVTFINGGQPGWSSHQIVMNGSEFSTWEPDVVLVGVGVRDTQVSHREDATARPTPWILRRYSVRWLQSLLNREGVKSTKSGDTVRVPATSFRSNLETIVDTFPNATVYFYMFPQVSLSPEHLDVVNTFQHWTMSDFTPADFFENDPIHLNAVGHRKLFEEINAHLAPILNP